MNEIAIDRIDGVSVVRMPHRVDVGNTKTFVDTLRAEIGERRTNIVLDLSKTETIDSTALGAIVQVYQSLRVTEGTLVLAGVSDGVQRVFAITRLDRVFKMVDSVEEGTKAAS